LLCRSSALTFAILIMLPIMQVGFAFVAIAGLMAMSATRFVTAVAIKLLATLAFALSSFAFAAFAFAAFAFASSTFALCTTASALASTTSVVAVAFRLAFPGRVAVLLVVVAVLAHIFAFFSRGESASSKGSVFERDFPSTDWSWK
jgi:hypothetical protein